MEARANASLLKPQNNKIRARIKTTPFALMATKPTTMIIGYVPVGNSLVNIQFRNLRLHRLYINFTINPDWGHRGLQFNILVWTDLSNAGPLLWQSY